MYIFCISTKGALINSLACEGKVNKQKLNKHQRCENKHFVEIPGNNDYTPLVLCKTCQFILGLAPKPIDLRTKTEVWNPKSEVKILKLK